MLVTNGRDHAPAVYGKIRVLAGGERLPRALPERGTQNRRLLAAYLDRPLIPENFSANECLDPWSGRSLDDWWTFYEGGTRLVEYLNHAGYNGLMLAVLADGSTIYPSTLLEPTPRYDTGAFFATAQDPVRKDVLEMLLRLFDREDLQLIPAVEFAAPLPELEAIRRAGGPTRAGHRVDRRRRGRLVRLVARPTRTGALLQRAPSARAAGDARRAAGTGRALRATLRRSPAWPCGCRPTATPNCPAPTGDWTTRRSPNSSATRSCACRATARNASPSDRPSWPKSRNRRAWLEWRAAQLGKFYRRAYEELAAIRPGSRLYLAGAGMIGGPELEAELRPALPRRTTIAAALLRVGIDARHFQDDPATDRPVAARTGSAASQPGRPRRGPRNQPDGRLRPLLPDRRHVRQPVLPPAARSPHRVVRPEEPLQAELHVAGFAAGARRASRTGGGSSTAWPRSTPR